MSRIIGTTLALLVLAIAVRGPAVADNQPIPIQGQPIDVVLCLDTSNSMDGLIASAKLKLWDIVNDLARAKPTPHLRVALYSYGNDGYDAKTGWVRKEVDLTTDLDEIYNKLNGLTTNGGTEYVGRVSRDAITQQQWSNDAKALRMLFVCGNEPANQDPVVRLTDLAKLAKEKGIYINAIYCGNADDSDAASWRQLASLAQGRYININQSSGTVAIATPFDKELAELGGKINQTMVVYGVKAEREMKQANQLAQDANAAKAGVAAVAGRTQTKGGALYCTADWDLVDRCKRDPNFDITKVPDDQLSDELKKMKPEERVAYVKQKMAERDAIQKQIEELGAKRQAYINEELKKNRDAGDKAFDAAVRDVLRQQAAQKGIHIPE
ncbi:MAG: vWA domain-containing protein [Gemmataceae bacterium]